MISQNSRSDSRDRAKNGATNSAKERKDLKNPQSLLLQIQSTFDKGNKIEFFKAFDALIPSELKKKRFSIQKTRILSSNIFRCLQKASEYQPTERCLKR